MAKLWGEGGPRPYVCLCGYRDAIYGRLGQLFAGRTESLGWSNRVPN